MEDATFELMAGEQRKVKGEIAFISDQTYNIDDMDAKFCMISLSYTGCYCLRCTKLIDPARRGMVEIDGEEHVTGEGDKSISYLLLRILHSLRACT